MKKKKRKKIRLKYRFIIFFLLLLGLIYLSINYLINMPISNIYIKGNSYFSDQQIIEMVGIENYPSSFKNSSSKLSKILKDNIFIKNVKVSKKYLTQVYIDVEENRPLFFNQSLNKTILLDGKQTEDKFNIPILINYVPDVIYQDFIKKMGLINTDVIKKISEIKYDPDEVDDARFLFTMIDSNYVYVTLNKLKNINNYNDIVKQFNNKKGILYLNSGGYFEIAK